MPSDEKENFQCNWFHVTNTHSSIRASLWNDLRIFSTVTALCNGSHPAVALLKPWLNYPNSLLFSNICPFVLFNPHILHPVLFLQFGSYTSIFRADMKSSFYFPPLHHSGNTSGIVPCAPVRDPSHPKAGGELRRINEKAAHVSKLPLAAY